MENFCPLGQCVCSLFFIYFWRRRMLKQKEESLSNANRHFFNERYGYYTNDDDKLLEYYIDYGGAKGFAEREALWAFDPSI